MQDRNLTSWPVPPAGPSYASSNAETMVPPPSLHNSSAALGGNNSGGPPLQHQLHHSPEAPPVCALRPPSTAMTVPTRKRSLRTSEGVAPSWSSPLLPGGSRLSLMSLHPSPSEESVAKRARRLSASLLHR